MLTTFNTLISVSIVVFITAIVFIIAICILLYRLMKQGKKVDKWFDKSMHLQVKALDTKEAVLRLTASNRKYRTHAIKNFCDFYNPSVDINDALDSIYTTMQDLQNNIYTYHCSARSLHEWMMQMTAHDANGTDRAEDYVRQSECSITELDKVKAAISWAEKSLSEEIIPLTKRLAVLIDDSDIGKVDYRGENEDEDENNE